MAFSDSMHSLFFLERHHLYWSRIHPTLGWSHFILINYICKDLISKQGHILRFQVNKNFGETLFNSVESPSYSPKFTRIHPVSCAKYNHLIPTPTKVLICSSINFILFYLFIFWMVFLFYYFYSFIHMCIHCLGHFSYFKSHPNIFHSKIPNLIT
jgi:hypothetical protein